MAFSNDDKSQKLSISLKKISISITNLFFTLFMQLNIITIHKNTPPTQTKTGQEEMENNKKKGPQSSRV